MINWITLHKQNNYSKERKREDSESGVSEEEEHDSYKVPVFREGRVFSGREELIKEKIILNEEDEDYNTDDELVEASLMRVEDDLAELSKNWRKHERTIRKRIDK